MNNPKQNTAFGEATRATSVASIGEAMDGDKKQKTMEQPQLPRDME